MRSSARTAATVSRTPARRCRRAGFGKAAQRFFGRPTDQALDLVPPKQLGRAAVRNAQAVVLALLLITGLGLEARADQMAAMTQALPTSTAEAPRQCAVALTVLLGTGFGLEESADQAPTVTEAPDVVRRGAGAGASYDGGAIYGDRRSAGAVLPTLQEG
jgi:hypothetical protein